MNSGTVSINARAFSKRSGQVYYENIQELEVKQTVEEHSLAGLWARAAMTGAPINKFTAGISIKHSVDVGGRWVTVEVSASASISCGPGLDALLAARDLAAHYSREYCSAEIHSAMGVLGLEPTSAYG